MRLVALVGSVAAAALAFQVRGVVRRRRGVPPVRVNVQWVACNNAAREFLLSPDELACIDTWRTLVRLLLSLLQLVLTMCVVAIRIWPVTRRMMFMERRLETMFARIRVRTFARIRRARAFMVVRRGRRAVTVVARRREVMRAVTLAALSLNHM